MNNTVFKIAILLVFTFSSCSVKNNLPVEDYKPTNCPTDGICSIEVLKNKTMVVETNEDGTMTYTLADDLKHSVVRFQFKRNMDQSEYDGSYSEMTVFEIDNSNSSQVLVDEELQNVKMLSGMFCFCRGQAGLHKVTIGKLNLTNNKSDKISFTLDYKLNESSELTKTISVVDNKLF